MNLKTILSALPFVTLLVACNSSLVAPTTADSATACSDAEPRSREKPPIDRTQIETAQSKWCAALVEIGKVGASGGDAEALASKVLSSAYNYDAGIVLFKPTLTFGDKTFRLTKAGALAYFVGGSPAFPDDQGFARKQWAKCKPEIAGVFVDANVALAMGNVHLEGVNGDKVTVDKTFGYLRGEDGTLRIVLHHSSLPYARPK